MCFNHFRCLPENLEPTSGHALSTINQKKFKEELARESEAGKKASGVQSLGDDGGTGNSRSLTKAFFRRLYVNGMSQSMQIIPCEKIANLRFSIFVLQIKHVAQKAWSPRMVESFMRHLYLKFECGSKCSRSEFCRGLRVAFRRGTLIIRQDSTLVDGFGW